MASVYGAAHLTICATRASDSHAEFLQHAAARKRFVELTSSSEDGLSTHRVYVRPPLPHKHFKLDGDQDTRLHPLKSRAWAFQEHFLSPRLLQFGHFEMAWECSHGLQCECGTIDKKNPHSKASTYEEKGLKVWCRHLLNTGSNEHTSFSNFWRDFIKAYSHMQLTFEKDRLVAIAGIVEHLRTRVDSEYFAGHWTSGLRESLLWQCVRNEPGKKVISYDVPSWSWASVQAEKFYPWWGKSNLLIFNVQDNNGFARGMGAITLFGYYFVATMTARPGRSFVKMQEGSALTLHLDYVVDENGKRLIDSQTCEVYCLVLGRIAGYFGMMVLKEVKHGTAAQAFRRIDTTGSYRRGSPIKDADRRAFCVI